MSSPTQERQTTSDARREQRWPARRRAAGLVGSGSECGADHARNWRWLV